MNLKDGNVAEINIKGVTVEFLDIREKEATPKIVEIQKGDPDFARVGDIETHEEELWFFFRGTTKEGTRTGQKLRTLLTHPGVHLHKL